MIGITSLNPFYAPIAFSLTCEDAAVAAEGLEIQPGDRAVCIGSGGDTAISLLSSQADRIDAVDMSFPQIADITLKGAAVRCLDLADVRVLLGVDRDPREAAALYKRVRPALPASVAAFWDRHGWIIANGVLWQGGVQRLIRAARVLGRLLFGRAWLAELRTLPTAGAAAQFVDRLARDWRMRLITSLVLNRVTVAAFYPHHAWRDLGSGADRCRLVLSRLETMLAARPPGAFPGLHPFLFESFPTEIALPPYLQASRFDRIKAAIPRLRVVHADVSQHLRTLPADSIAAFGLLNVVDWYEPAGLSRLFLEVRRCSVPGARLLTYSRNRPLDIEAATAAGFALDGRTSARLESIDGLRYYRYTYLLRSSVTSLGRVAIRSSRTLDEGR